jgi:hypothetical protein
MVRAGLSLVRQPAGDVAVLLQLTAAARWRLTSVPTDVLSVIGQTLATMDTPALVAASSSCRVLRGLLSAEVARSAASHAELVALVQKLRIAQSNQLGKSFQRSREDCERACARPADAASWVAGRLTSCAVDGTHDPRGEAAGSPGDGLCTAINWRDARLDAHDATVLSRATAELRCERCDNVDLSANALGGAGAHALVPWLERLHALHTLDVSECALTDAAVGAIAGALRHRRMQRLCLGSNPFGDVGVGALCAVLSPAWAEMRVLQLGDTDVADEGARALCAALDAGALPQLMQLWLAATRISAVGRALLSEAMLRHQSAAESAREAGAAGSKRTLTCCLRVCW